MSAEHPDLGEDPETIDRILRVVTGNPDAKPSTVDWTYLEHLGSIAGNPYYEIEPPDKV